MSASTQEGISALKLGDKLTARQKLRASIQEDAGDIQAWMWLSGAVDSDQERIECLQQVLRLDPDNKSAARGLAQLVASGQVTLHAGSPGPVLTQTKIPQKTEPHSEASPPILAEARQEAGKLIASEKAQSPDAKPINRPQERILFEVKPSLLPTLVAGGFVFLMIGFFIFVIRQLDPLIATLGALVLIFMALTRLSRVILKLLFTKYILTTKNLIVQSGILSRTRKTIPVHKIQDVSYQQSFLERLFSIGDVIVESAGERGSIHLVDLDDCVKKTDQILRLMR